MTPGFIFTGMNKQINLGHDPVLPLFMKYAIPSILGMFGMTIAGIVDGVIVGRFLGAEALAAVNITYPLASVAVGISLMMGVGGTTLAASALGAGRDHEAGNALSVTLSLIIGFSLLFTILFLVFIEPLIGILGGDQTLNSLVKSYAVPLIPFFLPFMLSIVLEGFIRVDGRPNFGMVCFLIGVVANIVLDLLFVAVFKWGLAGAALATGGSQILAFVPMLFHFILKKGRIHLQWPRFRSREIVRIIANGSSELANNSADGITRLVMNYVLIQQVGTLGVSAYSIVGYICSLAYVLYIGFASVLPPTVGYNHGRGDQKRMTAFFKLGIVSAFLVGIAAFAVLFFAGSSMARLFTGGDSSLQNLTAEISRWFSPALLLIGVNITISVYFTAIHKALKSALLALSGSLVMRLVFLFALPLLWGNRGIWLSVVFAQVVTLILSVIFLKDEQGKREQGKRGQPTIIPQKADALDPA